MGSLVPSTAGSASTEKSDMVGHVYHCRSVLLSASIAAAASLIVAADSMDAPAMRIVAASPNHAGQDDNFRLATMRHGANATDPDHAGIWKAATPAGGTMHGEFRNNDPIGLSAGVKIKADCSINWVDPDSRLRYCFSTATSLIVFLDAPHAYLARAIKNWDRISTSANR
jgi:hypothetical protein